MNALSAPPPNYITSQKLNADRPEARSALGTFYARRGLVSEAEADTKPRSSLSAQFAPAAINLADLYRGLKRDREGENVLRDALAASPRDAGLHHALGLTLTRLKRPDEALNELRRAAELAPEQARYVYVYGVGLHSSGRVEEAMTVLKENLVRHPEDRATLSALVSFSRDAGDFPTALDYAERLTRIMPNDPNLRTLIESLRAQATKSGAP